MSNLAPYYALQGLGQGVNQFMDRRMQQAQLQNEAAYRNALLGNREQNTQNRATTAFEKAAEMAYQNGGDPSASYNKLMALAQGWNIPLSEADMIARSTLGFLDPSGHATSDGSANAGTATANQSIAAPATEPATEGNSTGVDPLFGMTWPFDTSINSVPHSQRSPGVQPFIASGGPIYDPIGHNLQTAMMPATNPGYSNAAANMARYMANPRAFGPLRNRSNVG